MRVCVYLFMCAHPLKQMAGKNHTLVADFVLVGFMDHPELQVPLFFLFLVIYIITLVGNLGMILLIRSDSQLHTPMYFFLSHLSFVDICYSSVITPKMLVNFLAKNKVISFIGCAMQFCFFAGLGGTERNHTTVTEFILFGFTTRPEMEVVLFVLFLAIYITTLMGNIGIITLICVDSCLHTPMYYFLSNLSFLDISYSSTIAPKMLVNFLAQSKTISFTGCAMQMYLFAAFADAECLLLAAMAYDRYVAICNPLLYMAMMSRRVCVSLIAGAYISGSVSSLVHTCFTFTLSFCGSNVIDHFFCDIPPLLALSCSDTHINEILLFALCGFIQTSTFVIILISYAYVLAAILRIHSAEGRCKAFNTCTSHLTAVTLFYGTLLFMYLRPSSKKISAVFYTLVVPMLNPLIYSLRNKEVKDALRRVMKNIPS
uniref:G-protein coupled receptors family 1 profile domain-containing protein n=1 Tax=Pelusios castaneus TaxID=367368 RepID=A0A8C8REJ5_9SAUR